MSEVNDMSDEMEFFIYLLEYYAFQKDRSTKEVLDEWDRKGITREIYEGYWNYHTERIENAITDIDSLIRTGKHEW